MRAAPLLLIAVGLIVVFRANIWNLGYDGQFLLGAALITGVAPHLDEPPAVAQPDRCCSLLAMAAGAAWTIIPAILKARYQTNEIITTLMMSFIGIGLANILSRARSRTRRSTSRRRARCRLDRMLPAIPGTRIHVGVLDRARRRARRALRAHAHRRSACACTCSAPTRAPPRTSGSTCSGSIVTRVPGQRRADRRRGGGRHPRRVGLHARQLEPRLRRHRDPVRLPRAPERARGDPVHHLLRRALDRRRPRRGATPTSRPTSCSCWSR